MPTFPYPRTVGGLIEIVLDEIVRGPGGKIVPGRQLFREFVPYGFDHRGRLAEALERTLAKNATVPSRLRFGINSRSTRRSGDVWIAEVSRLVIRLPRCSSRLHAEAPRFAAIASCSPKPGYISTPGSEFVYAIWEMVTQRDPRDVFPDLLRLEQGLGLEVSKEPAYMLPVPGSRDWSRGEPREVEFVPGGHQGLFRNTLVDLMDRLGFPSLSEEELASNPYRPTPVPLDEIPAGPHEGVVRFAEPVTAYTRYDRIHVEVVDGPLVGHSWNAKLPDRGAALLDALEAEGALTPGRGRGARDLIGHGADVVIEKFIPKRGRKKERLYVAEWGSSCRTRRDARTGSLDVRR